MSNDFGSWLREEIKKSGRTQTEFADLIGVEQPQLSRILSGDRGASNSVLENIATILSLPSEEIFRKAGILRPKTVNKQDELIEKLIHRISKLSPEDQAQVGDLIELLLNRRERIRASKKIHQHSQAPDTP